MAVIGEAELRQCAERFMAELIAVGFSARLLDDSFRDYLVKVAIANEQVALGNWCIYYKAKTSSFTPVTREIQQHHTHLPQLQRCWERAMQAAKPSESVTLSTEAPTDYSLYTDGSSRSGMVGYAVVILQNGVKIETLSGIVPAAFAGAHQVGAEIYAVMQGLTWCKDHAVEEVTIYYDFMNLERWATGEYQARDAISQIYVRFLQDCPIRIRWNKVNAHAGVWLNELADALARESTTSSASDGGKPTNRMAEAERVAREFAAFLNAQGICTSEPNTMNGMFVRLEILQQETRIGLLDIYNTARKHLSPDWRAWKNTLERQRLAALWTQFRTGLGELDNTKKPAIHLAEVDYYYAVLQPYAQCRFDFSLLADALERAARAGNHPLPSIQEVRYDFSRLTEVYLELQNKELK